jgi:hypothetical protein
MAYQTDANGDIYDTTDGSLIGNVSQGFSVDQSGNLNFGDGTTSSTVGTANPVNLNGITTDNTNTLANLATGLGSSVNSINNALGGALGTQSLANVGGAAYLGNAITNSANNIAGAATGAAQNIGANAQQNIGNLQSAYGLQESQYSPYIQTGQQGNAALQQNLPYLSSQFTNADLNSQLAPNYQFQLQQGLGQVQNQQHALGGLVGGNALQGLQNYAQNYAGNAYQNAFNNAQAQKTNIYNTLSGIAGIGQNALTGQSGLVSGLGTNTANISTGAAQQGAQLGLTAAQAAGAGTTNAANVYSNALNQVANNNTLATLLSKQTTPNITVNATGGAGGSGGSGGSSLTSGLNSATNAVNAIASNASGGGLVGALGSAGSALSSAVSSVASFFGF